MEAFSILQSARGAYYKEKCSIEANLEIAKSQLDLQNRFDTDPEFAVKFSEVVENWDSVDHSINKVQAPKPIWLKIPEIVCPSGLDEVENPKDIEQKIAKMSAKHFEFLKRVKKVLDADPSLLTIFKQVMVDAGGSDVFDYINLLQTYQSETVVEDPYEGDQAPPQFR